MIECKHINIEYESGGEWLCLDCGRGFNQKEHDQDIIYKLCDEVDSLSKAFRDVWPLVALKSKWLEKHPKHRATLESIDIRTKKEE